MWTLLNKGEEHAHAADNTKPDGTASRQTKKKGKYETMKRALAMILCVLMVMSLAACGSKDPVNDGSKAMVRKPRSASACA